MQPLEKKNNSEEIDATNGGYKPSENIDVKGIVHEGNYRWKLKHCDIQTLFQCLSSFFVMFLFCTSPDLPRGTKYRRPQPPLPIVGKVLSAHLPSENPGDQRYLWHLRMSPGKTMQASATISFHYIDICIVQDEHTSDKFSK